MKIYATDIDDEALAQARQASYSEAELEGVPYELRAKYFERRDNRKVFHPDLRRTMIFGRNDLVQDAPNPGGPRPGWAGASASPSRSRPIGCTSSHSPPARSPNWWWVWTTRW